MTVSVPDARIDVLSAMVGLTIAGEWRPGVTRFLDAATEMAALLEAVPLDAAELALAPVFRLPEPAEVADDR